MALTDSELPDIAPDLRRRIEKTTSVRVTDRLPKVADAGTIRVVDGREVQVMHNGVLVEKDCYGGPWMTEVITRLRGHHEPQEEIAFAAIVDRLKADEAPVMIELGSYWAYYSLWLKSEIPGATVVLVEPDPRNLQVGVRNFELNALSPAAVLQAAVAMPHDSTVDVMCESDAVMRPIRAVSLDGLLEDQHLPRVDLVVCDVQGAEVEMLAGAVDTVRAGNVRFMVISTHWSDTDPLIHQVCRARVQELGGHIICEHSLPESCSADGLIVVSFDDRDRDMQIEMPVVRAVDSEVGELEWMIARRMGVRGIVWGAVDLVPAETRVKLGATSLGGALHRRLAARAANAAAPEPQGGPSAAGPSPAGLLRRGVRALAESELQQRIESERHTRQFARSMDRHAEDFAGGPLPRWYGVGLTERAVEFGWVRHHLSGGRVLDAGSALNHEVILDRILPVVDELTIVTLEPEERSWPQRGVQYLYQDLRHLDIADATFDAAVSVSTLEHVGLDNSRFYDSDAPQGDPDRDAQQAMRELGRVVRPGGTLLVTVPFGAAWRSDWVRVLDGAQLDALIGAVQPAAVDESIFRRSRSGWQRVTREQAGDAAYRRFWSEAVACVRIQLPEKGEAA